MTTIRKSILILVAMLAISGLTSVTYVQHANAIVQCTFTRDLYLGVSGNDVLCLQQYLNDGGNAIIASSGAGSPGNETTYFGSLTQSAVARWQSANGISPAVGYFGSLSRAKYNQILQGSTSQPSQQSSTSPSTQSSGPGVQVLLTPSGVTNLSLQSLQPVTVNWSYANVPGYKISCPSNVVCKDNSGSYVNSPRPVSGSAIDSLTFTPPGYGSYSFTIQGLDANGNPIPGIQQSATVVVQSTQPQPLTQPVVQQQSQSTGSNPLAGVISGCSGGGLIPCFDIWTLTALSPKLPNCNFNANPSTIVSSQSSTLSWSCSDTAYCEDPVVNGKTVGSSGSDSVSPTKTTTYNLYCHNPNGDNSFSTTVTVTKALIKEIVP